MRDRLQRMASTGRDRITALLVLATLGLGVHGILEWLRRAHRLVDSPQRTLLLAMRLVALALVVATLVLAWRRRAALSAGAKGPVGFAVRGLGMGVLIAWSVGSAAQGWLADDKNIVSSAFWSAFIGFVALWTGGALWAPERLFAERRRWLDTLAWNLLLGLLLAEVVICLWAWSHPSPFLWDESSVVASLQARRLEPGASFYGSPVNSGGYYDEEFHPPRGDDEIVVAVLADSFGVGVVPYAANYTTVAERRLAELLPGRRIALHNFGVVGIGLPEYAWLLEHEVPATSPQLVLLNVFVGNDIQSHTRQRGRYYSFQRFVVYELLRRIAGVSGAAAQGGALDATHLADDAVPEIPEPGQEVPTFDVDRFLKIEQHRVVVTDPNSREVEAWFERFFAHFAAIQGSAGRRLRVVLIPDEFQVNDVLWQQLLERAGEEGAGFERELPQRRLLAYCAEHELACLDLLPALRAANTEAPVYHLRDTHWNARGNAVAGEEIARFLAESIPAK